MKQPIRVLVVDDSAFIRHVVTKKLAAYPDILVVGDARDGIDALKKVEILAPDVVTLDVVMPHLDGLAALQKLMKTHPLPVIMLSALTQQSAQVTIQALLGGAVDFVPKPDGATKISQVVEELAAKVRVAADTKITPMVSRVAIPRISQAKAALRVFIPGDSIVVIGASAGGPRALQQILSALPGDFPAPVIIVQHMPAPFTRAMAERLNKTCRLTVREAVDGDQLAHGLVLLAPGDYHLQLSDTGQVLLNQQARRNGVRPAVDVTLESAAEHFQKAVIGVILTGMGMDGTAGAKQVKAAGGKVIAEHHSTSVVYSMPRHVVEAGLADEILTLIKIPAVLQRIVENGIS